MFFTLGEVNVSYAWAMPSAGLQALLYNCLHRKWLNSNPRLISYFFLSTFWRQQNKPAALPGSYRIPAQSLAVAALQNFLTERCVHFLPPCFLNFGGGLLVWVCFLLKFLLRQSPPSSQKCFWCGNTVSKPQEGNIFSQLSGSTCESAAVGGRMGLFVPFAVVAACSCQKPPQAALKSPGWWCSPATRCFF